MNTFEELLNAWVFYGAEVQREEVHICNYEPDSRFWPIKGSVIKEVFGEQARDYAYESTSVLVDDILFRKKNNNLVIMKMTVVPGQGLFPDWEWWVINSEGDLIGKGEDRGSSLDIWEILSWL